MTGMSDLGWQAVHDKGAQVSLAAPIEMNMRHGMPPILKMQSLGMEPSLSVDVECTLTADFFTQLRSCMNLQRALLNQMILDQGNPPDPVSWGLPGAPPDVPNGDVWPTPPAGTIAPLTTRDVLRFGTMNGAKALRLDGKTGSLTPGKEADIIILDATRINVAPLNQVPGAVVSLMDRTNVETVIVAGKVRKWKGQLLDVDLPHLRRQLEASRDYVSPQPASRRTSSAATEAPVAAVIARRALRNEAISTYRSTPRPEIASLSLAMTIGVGDAILVEAALASASNVRCSRRHLPNWPYSASGALARLKSTLRPPHCVVGSCTSLHLLVW
jgi:hypothetical protein